MFPHFIYTTGSKNTYFLIAWNELTKQLYFTYGKKKRKGMALIFRSRFPLEAYDVSS